MLDPQIVPTVDSNECLSRFIYSSRHIRSDSGTIKADAFIPHPPEELSVNRDRDATDEETWSIGASISAQRKRTLHGRGDVVAATYQRQKLKTVAAPVDGNPNHVNVTQWPSDKAGQKLIAQEIAAVSKLVRPPTASV